MPMAYRYDAASNAIYGTPTGVLTVIEILSYFQEVFQDEEVASGFIEIINFDDVEDFAFRYTEASRIADAYASSFLPKECMGTVFIARNPLGYGIARMFGTIVGDRADMRVVQSEEELNQELAGIRNQKPAIQ